MLAARRPASGRGSDVACMVQTLQVVCTQDLYPRMHTYGCALSLCVFRLTAFLRELLMVPGEPVGGQLSETESIYC